MPILYSMQNSGNCYKPRLLMAQLGMDFDIQPVNSLTGETRTSAFLAINPHGKVPALVLDDGRALFESNAMLVFLAHGSAFLPSDPYLYAQVMQWLFWEQYSHEPYIAVARRWWSLEPEGRQTHATQFPDWHQKGHAALEQMDNHLKGKSFFVDNQYSIADIALYAYTHVADEGGFDMTRYPEIGRWLDRVRTVKGHVDIEWHP
ncbi:MAG: glutathione S-transferase family protein [Stappiaceae bacterium]